MSSDETRTDAQAMPQPTAARVPSIPPGRALVAAIVLGACTDWLAIAAIWHLTALRIVSADIGVGIIASLAVGTLVAKARGKLTGTSLQLLLSLATAAAAQLQSWRL